MKSVIYLFFQSRIILGDLSHETTKSYENYRHSPLLPLFLSNSSFYIESSPKYFHEIINFPRFHKTDTSSNLLLIIIICSKFCASTNYEGEV